MMALSSVRFSWGPGFPSVSVLGIISLFFSLSAESQDWRNWTFFPRSAWCYVRGSIRGFSFLSFIIEFLRVNYCWKWQIYLVVEAWGLGPKYSVLSISLTQTPHFFGSCEICEIKTQGQSARMLFNLRTSVWGCMLEFVQSELEYSVYRSKTRVTLYTL